MCLCQDTQWGGLGGGGWGGGCGGGGADSVGWLVLESAQDYCGLESRLGFMSEGSTQVGRTFQHKPSVLKSAP